jgi:hypothetical protein
MQPAPKTPKLIGEVHIETQVKKKPSREVRHTQMEPRPSSTIKEEPSPSSKIRGNPRLPPKDKTPSRPTATLARGLRHLIRATSQNAEVDTGPDLLLKSSAQQTGTHAQIPGDLQAAADTKVVLRLTHQFHHLPANEQRRIKAEVQRLRGTEMPDKVEALGLLQAISRGPQVPSVRKDLGGRQGSDKGDGTPVLVPNIPSSQTPFFRRLIDNKYEGDDKVSPRNMEGEKTGDTLEPNVHAPRKVTSCRTFDNKSGRGKNSVQSEVVKKAISELEEKQERKQKVQESREWNKDITDLSAPEEYYGDEHKLLSRAAKNRDENIESYFINVKIGKRMREPITTPPSADPPTNTPLRQTRPIPLLSMRSGLQRSAQAVLPGKAPSSEPESPPVPFAADSSVTEKNIVAPTRRVKSEHRGPRKGTTARQRLVERVSAWLNGQAQVPQASSQQQQRTRVFGSGHLRYDVAVDEDDEGGVDTLRGLDWIEEDGHDVQRPDASLVVKGVVAGVEEGERWEIKTVEEDAGEAERTAARESGKLAEKGQRKAKRREAKRREAEKEAEKKAEKKAGKKVDSRWWYHRQKKNRV